jgi:methionyl-tRNA synthetase
METINIDYFKKVRLQVGLVVECEKVDWSNKLLKMKVKFGEEYRTVLSGIAKYITPEEMINNKYVFVTNLEPRKIQDLESQGMILTAEDENGNVTLISPVKDSMDGCVLS